MNTATASLPARATLTDLAATLVALANGRGGTLLLSLDDVSVDDAIDRVLEASLMVIPTLNLPKPRPVAGRQIAVTIPPDLSKVFALDGRYLLREGNLNRPISPRELRRLLIERGEVSYEEEPTRDANVDDLDWAAIDQYAAKISTRRESPRDLLVRRGCLVKSGTRYVPTHAGILLFGNDPQRFLRGARITAVRFAGVTMSDTFTRQDIGGSLPTQIRRAETFLLDQLRRNVRLGASMERDEQIEYPMEAARELIVNAVSHRDYSVQGDDIRLFIFADRLEVTSPGKLAGQVTLDNIVDERFSRNPAVVQVLSDMGFIERLGYGVDRIISLMAAHDLPAPEFTETAGGFRATLFNSGANVPETSLTTADPNVILTPRQEAALEFLRRDGNARITNGDLQEMFPNVHSETIRRDLADLVSKGLLLKRGEKRGSFYILNK